MKKEKFYVHEATQYIICGQLISENAFIHQKRCLRENVLILVNEGVLCMSVDGISYEVEKGQYIILPQHVWHSGTKESTGKLSYYWIHFKNDESSLSVEHAIGLYGSFMVNGRIAVLFHQLADISFDEDDVARQMCNIAVKMILLELMRENDVAVDNRQAELPGSVASAIEYVNRNYVSEIVVSDIATKFGYTADYFSTLFRKSTGVTFTNFVNQVRVRASKALLAGYGVSIKEVAYSCGFSDEKYFMRVFKALEGITPTEYRKNSERSYINEE